MSIKKIRILGPAVEVIMPEQKTIFFQEGEEYNIYSNENKEDYIVSQEEKILLNNFKENAKFELI